MTEVERQDTTHVLSARLEGAHQQLARDWFDRLTELLAVQKNQVFPTWHLLDHIPDLIVEIARYLRAPEDIEIAANTGVMTKAAELGRMRFEQRASVHQLLREYEIFSEILETFLRDRAEQLGARANVSQSMTALSRVSRAVRVLQQQTVDTFVDCYTETIERQTAQLRNFSRLVSHEIRQPLGVLQVLGHVLPVAEGDVQAGGLMETFRRNVVRLGEVANKLERLTRLTHSADNAPTEQVVDINGIAIEIARQLSDMANARGVVITIDAALPMVLLDAARLELVLMNLLANGIKYADPSKADRLVRICALQGRPGLALQVTDNGIGIPASRLETIFDQFVRVHSHRDGELGAQGLGIGLSIVRECMEAMNATITVASIEGEGTTFRLEWPSAVCPGDGAQA